MRREGRNLMPHQVQSEDSENVSYIELDVKYEAGYSPRSGSELIKDSLIHNVYLTTGRATTWPSV